MPKFSLITLWIRKEPREWEVVQDDHLTNSPCRLAFFILLVMSVLMWWQWLHNSWTGRSLLLKFGELVHNPWSWCCGWASLIVLFQQPILLANQSFRLTSLMPWQRPLVSNQLIKRIDSPVRWGVERHRWLCLCLLRHARCSPSALWSWGISAVRQESHTNELPWLFIILTG